MKPCTGMSFPPVLGYSTFHTSSIISALLLQYMVIQASLCQRGAYTTDRHFKTPLNLLSHALNYILFNSICYRYYGIMFIFHSMVIRLQ